MSILVETMPEPKESAAQLDARNIERKTAPLFNVTDVFGKIDSNNNGLGLAEINRAIQSMQPNATNPSGDNVYTLPLLVLKNCRQEFKALSNDGADDSKRISPKDKNEFQKIPQAVAMRMLARSMPILREIDADNNHLLSRDEITRSMTGDPKSALNQAKRELLKNLDKISQTGVSNYYPGNIHIDMMAYQMDGFLKTHLTPQQLALANKAEWAIDDAQKRLSPNNDKLFANDKVDPKADEVRQNSTVGDCTALASFCTAAAKDPASIKSMIKESPDGKTLTITLPFKVDGELISATIPKPNRAQRGLYANSSDSGYWANALSAGVGQFLKDHPDLHAKLTGVKPSLELASEYDAPANEILKDGAMRYFILEALTGKPVEKIDLKKLDHKQLDDLLRTSKSKPVTLASDGHWPKKITDPPVKPPKLDNKKTITGEQPPSQSQAEPKQLAASPNSGNNGDPDDPESRPSFKDSKAPEDVMHAFALLDYNQEKKTVTIYNPWHHGELLGANGQPRDGSHDGKMELTLSEFQSYFHAIYIPKDG